MTDSVVRLKVESQEYDAKLKRATSGLQALEQSLRASGKSFADADKNTIQYVQALGRMGTVSQTARGRIGEMSSAFVELSQVELRLTDQERQSPVGQALVQSLQQLRERTIEAKNELQELNDQISNVEAPEIKTPGGGLFGEGGLTGMMQVFGGNLLSQGVTKLTSELADTVQQSIELARSGEGVRLAFERLNQPGLLNNLKEATHGTVSELELMKAAVKFDDFNLPVEQLGTLLAFAQKKAKDTGQSVDYMVDSIVTGLGRKSLMILDNLGLSASQIKDRMAETGDMTTAVADIIKEQMSQAGEYVETAADRAARAAADASNEMEELGRKAMPVAEEWASAWNNIKLGGMSLLTTVLGPVAKSIKDIRDTLNGMNGFSFKDGIPNLAEGAQSPWAGWKPGTDHTVKAPGGYVEVTDAHTGKVISGKHFDNLDDKNAISDWQKTLFKSGGSGRKKATTEETIQNQFNTAMLKGMANTAKLKPEDVLGPSDAWTAYTDAIAKGFEKTGDEMSNLTKFTKDFDPLADYLKKDAKLAKQQAMAFDMAAQSAQNLGAAFASLDDPAARAAGTVISAIANIALGFGQAVASAGSMGPWAWLAYVAAGTAALATTISTVHSLTGYAEGGVVKGNTYSGDQIPIMANAGETVLTAAQTNNLAAQIQENGNNGWQMTARVSGEQIILVGNRFLRRSGRGEFATFK